MYAAILFGESFSNIPIGDFKPFDLPSQKTNQGCIQRTNTTFQWRISWP
jgi:hypothetical protein